MPTNKRISELNLYDVEYERALAPERNLQNRKIMKLSTVRWLKYIITQARFRLYLEFMLRRVDLCSRCNEPATRRQSVWPAMRESKQVNANLPEDTERPEETRLQHGPEKFSDNKRLRIIGFETARKHSRKR